MHEETQHNRPTEHTVEVPLGALLLKAADAIEHQVETAAARDIAYATDMLRHPGHKALAHLIEQLLGHCTTLAVGVGQIPDEQRSARARSAVTTWEKLAHDGPGDGAFGDWSYCKHLARAAKDMLSAIREHRTAQRQQPPTFVGRSGMPPVPVDGP